MKMAHSVAHVKQSLHSAACRSELALVAHGSASLAAPELATLRQQSIDRFSSVLRPQLLKHSDEQTLAAAAALDTAIQGMQASDDRFNFGDWAVVSATRYLGRTAFAAVIDKYKLDGPWGVSVQVIPHTSPHALASTLSLALASHGPCLGAGTAPGNELDALLAAVTFVDRQDVAGAWVIFSGWSDAAAQSINHAGDPRCEAVALAVVANGSPIAARALSVGRVGVSVGAPGGDTREPPYLAPAELAKWLAAYPFGDAAIVRLGDGGIEAEIELFGTPRVAAGPRAPHFQLQPSAMTP